MGKITAIKKRVVLISNTTHCFCWFMPESASSEILYYSITLTLITPSIASILGIIFSGTFTPISTIV